MPARALGGLSQRLVHSGAVVSTGGPPSAPSPTLTLHNPGRSPPVELLTFSLNLAVAALLGAAVGVERQWHQNPAGLRTCMLVCLGACLFVSLTALMGDTQSPTRIASYIVSGVGFLAGGVILKEGVNVRGLNTAATLWCCAALGTLSGAGQLLHALVGAGFVLAVHLCLRPITHRIDTRASASATAETFYRVRAVCDSRQ